ncbi:glycosyltransferase [Candidatus Pelagibacter sp. HIMB1517]|uniref:glycosyltransferase n=1 Tax=Candidatus Pelagibacter sp. HIMB1517 TaxID=3413341 RepID=UPI003F82FAB2
MNIFFEATNIKEGGALSHLINLVEAADPKKNNFKKIIILSSKKTLSLIPKNKHILKIENKVANKHYFIRFLWQIFFLKKILKKHNVNLIFCLSGAFFIKGYKYVLLNQNFLPFDYQNLRKYFFSPSIIRLLLLRFAFFYSIRNASGVFFLTNYVKKIIIKQLPKKYQIKKNFFFIIPHGIKKNNFIAKKSNKKIKIIYLSNLDYYKNQIELLNIFKKFYSEKIKLKLDFYGSYDFDYYKKFIKIKRKLCLPNSYVEYKGLKDRHLIIKKIKEYDIFLFASSCESFAVSILDALAAKLPIIINDIPVVREILGKSAYYFNIKDSHKAYLKILKFVSNSKLRNKYSKLSYQKYPQYSVKKNVYKTFKCLNIIFKKK